MTAFPAIFERLNQIDPVAAQPIPVLFYVLAIIIGPVLGSFASAVIHRSRLGQSWIVDSDSCGAARSACPHCGGQLKWIDLVPIISWLCLRGKCRMCKAPVSASYPLLELAALVLTLSFLFVLGASFSTVIAIVAVPFLLTILVLSWEGRKLPSDVLAVLFALGIGLRLVAALNAPSGAGGLKVFLDGGLGAIFYAALGFMMYQFRLRILKASLKARGEIPLLAALGVWFGVSFLPIVLISAGVYGFIAAIIRILVKAKPQAGMLHPFAASFVIVLLFGGRILESIIP